MAENYLHKEGIALPVERSAKILTQEYDPPSLKSNDFSRQPQKGDSHGDIRLSAHPKLSGKTPVGVWTNRKGKMVDAPLVRGKCLPPTCGFRLALRQVAVYHKVRKVH